MSSLEPESGPSFVPVGPFWVSRQQRQSILQDWKESFNCAVLGFCGAVKRRARKQTNSCIPLRPLRRVLERSASWPRRASGRRDQSSSSAQTGFSSAGYRRSRSWSLLASRYFDVITAASRDVTPLYNSNPEYMSEVLSELEELERNSIVLCTTEAEHDGDGNSTVTTLSENKSAGNSTVTTVSENSVAIRFRGFWQKSGKEIRLPISKKTLCLGTYATREEAARARDAGIFYHQRYNIPYNFPDSPQVLPPVNATAKDISANFVKEEARRNAARAWPLRVAPYPELEVNKRRSSYDFQSSRKSFRRPVKKRKSMGGETFGKCRKALYTLQEVQEVTNNYARKIGESHSGRVYWGKLQTGQEVAVKVWTQGSYQAAEEFHMFRTVCDIWEEHHKYLVQLIGYCEEGEQISIYEYMPGGTLQKHLDEKGMLSLPTHALDWGTRLKIALKVARGLRDITFFGVSTIFQRFKIFLTEENEVPKIRLQMYRSQSGWTYELDTGGDNVFCVGVMLLQLICGCELHEPRVQHFIYSVLENPLSEDFGKIEEIIDPSLGSNYHKESLMKVKKIADLTYPQSYKRPKMHVVVNKILVALKLEHHMGKKGAVATSIRHTALQSDTCGPIQEVLKEIVLERSSVDEFDSNCELKMVDSEGGNQQQPETSNAQFPGSRSSKFKVEMFTAHDIENLSPRPKLGANVTSIEGIPNASSARGSIMVAGRKGNEVDLVELLFPDVESMAEVVGVGIDWAKVVVTKEMDVEVRQIGEGAWRDFWSNLKVKKVHNGFELINIILPEPDTRDCRPSHLVVEDLTENFGVGLTRGDVTSVYVQDHNEHVNDHGFFPLVLDLAKYMGLQGKNVIKTRPVSNSEVGSSKRTAESRSSQEQSGEKNGTPQDPPQGPPQDPHQDPSQDPPQDPPEPLAILPLDTEETKVLIVIIFPEWGCVRQGFIAQVHPDDPINSACIAPILRFEFEVKGNHRKITTTLTTQCNLGEGGPKINPKHFGYFQDNITISLNCSRERAATLSSARVENGEVVKRTITHINSRSSVKGCSGQLGGPGQLLSIFGVQAEASCGGTTERSDSLAHEISITQLGCFHVNPQELAGSLVYNFLYPPEVVDYIAKGHHDPRELITAGIGRTFWPSIVGEWDNLDTSKKCKYSFKTKRDITSVIGLRHSHANREEPECFKQSYEVPLWVNHAMTHIFHRHKTIELKGPGVKKLNHVIGTNPALHVDGT